jgi:hypothetical protein
MSESHIEDVQRVAPAGPRERVGRIEIERLAEMITCLPRRLLVPLVEEVAALQIQPCRRLAREWRRVRVRRPDRRIRPGACTSATRRTMSSCTTDDILQRRLVRLGPQVFPVACRRDAMSGAPARPTSVRCLREACPRPAASPISTRLLPESLNGRIDAPGDHAQAANRGELCDQLGREAVSEIAAVSVGAEARQRQHGQMISRGRRLPHPTGAGSPVRCDTDSRRGAVQARGRALHDDAGVERRGRAGRGNFSTGSDFTPAPRAGRPGRRPAPPAAHTGGRRPSRGIVR